MALQALAAPGLVRARFRMALLSGEVETQSNQIWTLITLLRFRMALLSGEVETQNGPQDLRHYLTGFRMALLSGEVETTTRGPGPAGGAPFRMALLSGEVETAPHDSPAGG